MAKIFLSYRRQDSAGVAGRIYDRLRAHFGDGAVFMDVNSIFLGENFRERIDAEVSECQVVLAVIGRNWAGESDADRRLDDPRDFVRIELESALDRRLPVIPILIDHVKMPSECDLPYSLVRLVSRNAINLDQGRDFDHHVSQLIKGVELFFQKSACATATPTRESPMVTEERQPSHSSPMKKVTNSLGMTLVRIEAGEFLMGTTRKQADQLMRLYPNSKPACSDAEQPHHPVRISRPFYIGTHAVTQGQFQALMGSNPSQFKGSDDLPVENVSWSDAVGFCNELSEREKGSPFNGVSGTEFNPVDGNRYRLPTEAEWEYACRANSATLYPFGDDARQLGEHAWFTSNAENKTHPVGQKMANAWGLYDMLGNVWEWCADGYDEQCYMLSPHVDPLGAERTSLRVVRGGCWNFNPTYSRPACRNGLVLEVRYNNLGFRVVAVTE
jgi:formylglycine-generating enzyme required for sulfatase activity